MTETTEAAAILAPLWKRKWMILVVGLIVGVATYFYYRHETPVYGAGTQIYLGQNAQVQAQLTGQTATVDTDREIADQVVLINSNVIGSLVEQRLAARHDLAAATGRAAASSTIGSDFIFISTTAHSAAGAADLANAYAQVYLQQHAASYQQNLRAVIASLREHLATVQAGSHGKSATESAQVGDLTTQIDQLDLQLSLGDSGDQQIDPAIASTVPLSPKPARNAIFGLVLGLVLASIAAYALSRFDRRLRSLAEVEAAFQAPVLAVMPSVARPITRVDGVPTPAEGLREPLRSLHTNLQLRAMVGGDDDGRSALRTLLFVSPEGSDGKSTLIAGLALVQRDAGMTVTIIEADLRRPVQAGMLGLDGSRGLVDVLSGTCSVRDAMQDVAAPAALRARSNGSSNGGTAVAEQGDSGSISLLPSGGTVANPPAILAGRAMPELLRTVADHFDQVLVDAPPPLQVSDALPLLGIVDGIVVVARIGHTVEPSARRLVELLSRSQHAPIVGIVATDASAADIEAFGVTSAYEQLRFRG